MITYFRVSIAALERQNSEEFVDRSFRRVVVNRKMFFKEGTPIWIPTLEFDQKMRAEEAETAQRREYERQQQQHQERMRLRQLRSPESTMIDEEVFAPGDRIVQGSWSGCVLHVSQCSQTNTQICVVQWDDIRFKYSQSIPSKFLLRESTWTTRQQRKKRQKTDE
jgi:hypothetical protein